MAIQMRRGLRKDFDPNKMLPGEWAVSIDATTSNQIVWMCFAAGVCKRMGTYEDFQSMVNEISADIIAQYKAEFNVILSEVQALSDAVESDKDSVATMHTQIRDEYLPQIANAYEYALLSKSYAVGGSGVREGEDSDNAKYYYNQTKQISQGLNGIVPMGTVTFATLPTENIVDNAMYNVSDAFTSDERFNDGGGIYYGPGNNVIWTAEGKWDVTASSNVTGIKGDAEDTYRQGNVNITAENIGLGYVKDTYGNTDISTIADGTVTGAVSKMSSESYNNVVASYLNNTVDPNTTVLPLVRTKHNNCPTSDREYVIMTSITDGMGGEVDEKRQIAFASADKNQIYYRCKAYGGSWFAWQRVVFESEFVTISGYLTTDVFAVVHGLGTAPFVLSAQIQTAEGVWTDMRTLAEFTHISANSVQIRVDRTDNTKYANHMVRFLLKV